MTATDRDRAVVAEVDRRAGVVPSVRDMAGAIGCSIGAVHASYARLGKRHIRPGKRDYPRFDLRVEPETFDFFDRLGRARGVSAQRAAALFLDEVARRRRERGGVTSVHAEDSEGRSKTS